MKDLKVIWRRKI